MTATVIAPRTTGVLPRWALPAEAAHPVAAEADMAALVAGLTIPGRWASVTRPGGSYEIRRIPGAWVVERTGASARFRRAADAARALWDWSV